MNISEAQNHIDSGRESVMQILESNDVLLSENIRAKAKDVLEDLDTALDHLRPETAQTYDDPYVEILNKIVNALHEANLHSHNMSSGEWFIFMLIAKAIEQNDPAVELPTMF